MLVSPRQTVVALALLDCLGLLLAGLALGGTVARAPYAIADAMVEALLLVGLWYGSRLAWWIMIALSGLGMAYALVRTIGDLTGRRVVFLALGTAMLVLLAQPRLRASLRPLRGARRRGA